MRLSMHTKQLRRIVVSLLVLFVFTGIVIAVTGCPRPVPENTPVIDLAVGDAGNGVSNKGVPGDYFDSAKVLLYFDVLNGDGQQDPDVVLDGANIPSLHHPISTVLTEHDLYVADDLVNVVNIWRDYRSLPSAKALSPGTPDVILNGNGSISEPQQILVADNRLFVATANTNVKNCCGGVLVFDDAAGITANRAPDLILDDPGFPSGMAYEDDRLYVADPSGERVLVYPSISDLLAQKGTPAPPIELSGPSWLNLDNNGPVLPWKVDVFDNHLYVTTATNFLFVFSPADNLQNGQAPDAVISETNGALNRPNGCQKAGDRLYVANLGDFGVPVKSTAAEKSNSIGLVAFDHLGSLVTGQQPSVAFDATNAQVPAVQDLAEDSGNLFVATATAAVSVGKSVETNPPSAPYPLIQSFYALGDVHIYRNPAYLKHGSPGEIVLPALKDFFDPLSIATNSRFP